MLLDKKVLIIEEDPEQQALIVQNLSSSLIGTEIADSVEHAIELLQHQGPFHLILLELNNQNYSAWTFLDKVRKQNLTDIELKPIIINKTTYSNILIKKVFQSQILRFNQQIKAIPIIVVSNSDKKEDILKAKSYKIAGYLMKPVNFTQLVTRITQYFEKLNLSK